MIPEPKINIVEVTRRLQRQELEGNSPAQIAIWGQIESAIWIRVRGQSRFWMPDVELGYEAPRYEQSMEDLVSGLYGTGLKVLYLVTGARDGVQIHMGLQGSGVEHLLRDALIGAFPGIRLGDPPPAHLGREINNAGLLAHMGRLTGIPTLKASVGEPGKSGRSAGTQTRSKDSSGSSAEQIERLLRALYGQDWGYLVIAAPVAQHEVRQRTNKSLTEIGLASSQMKWQVQKMHQLTYSQVQNRQEGQSETVSGEIVDRLAEYGVELLESELARLKRGQALGMWETDVHFFAADQTTLQRTSSLLRAVFSGVDSEPEPIRTFECGGGKTNSRLTFSTLYHSAELATLTQLPRQEFPGYFVTDYARFDVDLPRKREISDSGTVQINVGKILDGGQPTNEWYVMDRSDFAKHGLVAGVTGSGKTNTIFYLLDKLWNRGKAGVPFLVIEPAKTEYRNLMKTPGFEGDLRVYTLGDERISPLRLNPFEFEIFDAEHRIPVQTHIDYLKSVFNAAFILYAPMPYVLEMCLHEIYEDRGWDLTSGQNRRLPTNLRGKESDFPVFPTLTDLYLKIEDVVNRLGYDVKLERDIKASLKARVGSLRLGGKGLMLDVPHSIPMKRLLESPTVLELEQIGNDDEKAFIIGLILTRIYEYRRVQARAQDELPELQHIAVFEEAHRLLRNVSTEIGTEESNTKGQAVETFANMLSEIRAYGQGVFIAEQIPTKLTPDAIKNTNLKIVQRIVAEDDREVLGGTMNITEAQKRQITALSTGKAVVYAEGADRPYLLQILRHQGKDSRLHVKDSYVRQQMSSVMASELYDPGPDWSRFMPTRYARDSEIRDIALSIVEHPEFMRRFQRYFLSLVVDADQAAARYWQAVRHFQRQVNPMLKSDADREPSIAVAVMIFATHRLFLQRGAQLNMPYDASENLRSLLLSVLIDIALHADDGKLDELTARHKTALLKFQKMYRHWWSLTGPGPFDACVACPNRCLYRYEVATIARDKGLERSLTRAINETDDEAMWAGVSKVAMGAAGQVLFDEAEGAQLGAALCYLTQMGASLELSHESQMKLVKSVLEMASHPE